MLKLAFLLATFFFSSSNNTVLLAPSMMFGELPGPVGPSDSLPAFPEAEGWGSFALRTCRSLPVVVHRVTNTNNSGSGSFRTALNAVNSSNFDIIVFTTGGSVALQSSLEPPTFANCWYVAGQTAPGGGFAYNGPGSATLIRLREQDNFVFRYLRGRVGISLADNGGQACGACSPFRHTGSGGSTDIMVDHNSFSWGLDGNGGLWRTNTTNPLTQRQTYSRNMAYEGFVNHAAGFNFGGRQSLLAGRFVRRISVVQNLFAHNNGRNPNCSAGAPAIGVSEGGCEYVNNVVYNWGKEMGAVYQPSVHDWVNNYMKSGPNGVGREYRVLIWENSNPATPYADDHSLYVSGNWKNGSLLVNQWTGMLQNDTDFSDLSTAQFQRLTRMPVHSLHPITELTADSAFLDVLADVGANARLACDAASWIDARDAADARIIADVQDGTGGFILDETEVGGFPTLAAGTPCADADTDGMPDAFETMCVGDATSLTVGGDISGDGYLNIEEYINGTNANGVDLNWIDNAGNEDGFLIDRDTGSGFARYDTVATDITTFFDVSGIPGYIYQVRSYNTNDSSVVAGPVTIACR